MRKKLSIFLIAIILGALLSLVLMHPSDSRNWLPEYERTASATLASTTATITNVRDWSYTDAIASTDWTTATVDTADVVRTWFVLEPFADYEGIGHTFLVFEFRDGSALSFSVQARQEVGESYSAIRGLFNSYELAYQWGTERDFIGRRLVYLAHPVRMYPLELTEADGAALLRSLIRETNELAETPRFYNTLTANCTNMLAKIVNEYYPNSLPFHHSWVLTGFADEYLMKEGLITVTGSIEETQQRYDLTPRREALRAAGTLPAYEYGKILRELLP